MRNKFDRSVAYKKAPAMTGIVDIRKKIGSIDSVLFFKSKSNFMEKLQKGLERLLAPFLDKEIQGTKTALVAALRVAALAGVNVTPQRGFSDVELLALVNGLLKVKSTPAYTGADRRKIDKAIFDYTSSYAHRQRSAEYSAYYRALEVVLTDLLRADAATVMSFLDNASYDNYSNLSRDIAFYVAGTMRSDFMTNAVRRLFPAYSNKDFVTMYRFDVDFQPWFSDKEGEDVPPEDQPDAPDTYNFGAIANAVSDVEFAFANTGIAAAFMKSHVALNGHLRWDDILGFIKAHRRTGLGDACLLKHVGQLLHHGSVNMCANKIWDLVIAGFSEEVLRENQELLGVNYHSVTQNSPRMSLLRAAAKGNSEHDDGANCDMIVETGFEDRDKVAVLLQVARSVPTYRCGVYVQNATRLLGNKDLTVNNIKQYVTCSLLTDDPEFLILPTKYLENLSPSELDPNAWLLIIRGIEDVVLDHIHFR